MTNTGDQHGGARVDAAADYVKGRTYVPMNNFGGAESAPFLWRDDA